MPSPSSRHHLATPGLSRDIDFVLHFPLRYEDETTLCAVCSLAAGQYAQVEGTVVDRQIRQHARRQLCVNIVDEKGDLLALRFFTFYGSQVRQLAPGSRVRARGEVRRGLAGLEMVHPAWRLVKAGQALPETLTPIYPGKPGTSQSGLRRKIDAALARALLPLCWSQALEDRHIAPLCLPTLAEAVHTLHHPPSDADKAALRDRTHPAWRRVKFEELLTQQLSLSSLRTNRCMQHAPALAQPAPADAEAVTDSDTVRDAEAATGSDTVKDAEAAAASDNAAKAESATDTRLARFKCSLPFSLTRAQQRALNDIATDMARTYPMQRLLQGDVGSGKTIVAALAALQVIDAGFQVVWMTPTEMLVGQHARTLHTWLAPLGIEVVWLTSSMKTKEKRAAVEAAETHRAQLIVGTQAVIQEGVRFARPGLIVIDEQHRFGVTQRLALRDKACDTAAGLHPHQLMMTATPIPRTLAMSYYADLDVSDLDELPPGRQPVLTKLISEARRDEIIAHVRQAALAGRQIYWVCPLIEESEVLQLQTAVDTFEKLSMALSTLRVGLLHGRLDSSEKARVMAGFTCGDIQLLVTTTVIEVGVDVPNASLMIIEHAERFGLAQLHQLRGRVGRGQAAATCVLLYAEPLSQGGRARLCVLRETNDGFEIARRDLEIRGPGEMLGAQQSGTLALRFADLCHDSDLIGPARWMADDLLHNHPDSVALQLDRWLGCRERYLDA